MKKITMFGILFIILVAGFVFAAGTNPYAIAYNAGAEGGSAESVSTTFTTTPSDTSNGIVPFSVFFNASQSTGNGTLTYAWDFDGDSTIDDTSGPEVEYTYTVPGDYTASLTVTDNDGSSTATKLVRVSARDITLQIKNSPISLSVLQGAAAQSFNINLESKGNSAFNVKLEIGDLSDGTHTITSANAFLIGTSPSTMAPGSTATYPVTLKSLPLTTVSGTYTAQFTVTAEDTETGSYSAPDYEVNGTITVTVTATPSGRKIEFSVASVSLGSDSQEREKTVSVKFKVKNTGNETVSGISFTPTAGFEDYEPTFTPASITSLASLAESNEITMSFEIPPDQDAGEMKIGEVVLSATSPSGVELGPNLIVNLETESNLVISKIEYDIQDGESGDLNEDDTSDELGDDARPGDTISITVTVENTFDDNIDIEDVDVDINDIDRDLDFDDDSDSTSSIKDGDDETFTFTLTIDDDAEEDTYYFDIDVTGTDDNGADHSDTFRVGVPVDIPSKEVKIIDASIIPSRITCESTAILEVEIENTGSDDLSSAVVEVESDYFDFKERKSNINIDEGDAENIRFSINVKNLEPGTYPIDITAYYKLSDTADTDRESIDLVVGECGTSDNDNTDNDTNGNSNDDSNVPPDYNDFPTGNVVYGDEDSGNPDWIIMGLLIAGIVLVIILIIVLLAKAAPPAK